MVDKKIKPITLDQLLASSQKPTAGKLLQWAVCYLKGGLEVNLRLEAEVLLAHVLGWSRTKLLAESRHQVEEEQAAEFARLIERRGSGYPLQYLTGHQEFMSLDLVVKEGVLIPRADTEVLVEKAIDILNTNHPKGTQVLVADICTGSGAIGLSIAHYIPESRVLLTDISETALEVARENRSRLGLADRVVAQSGDLLVPAASWLQEQGAQGTNAAPIPVMVKEQGHRANAELREIGFDLIASNPPYISQAGWQLVEAGVKQYEPTLALAGGVDGLDFYRRLIPEAAPLLKTGGYLLVEIGFDQGEAVQELFRKAGAYSEVQVVKDYGGRDRVVIGKKK